LDGHRFDAETTRLMGIAFETALVAVRQTDGADDPPRDAIANGPPISEGRVHDPPEQITGLVGRR
jgi:hypothetical protein